MDERAEELKQVAAIRAAVLTQPTLASILDQDRFTDVDAEVRDSSGVGALASDPAGIIAKCSHPYRGVDWFERDQKLLLQGRVAEIDDRGRWALTFLGVDPLINLVPLLESRLAALQAAPFKQQVIKMKFDQLRATAKTRNFQNHLFEASVLGDLGLKGVLRDVEESSTAVDGVIELARRNVLVEATNTTQAVIPDFTGVMFVDPGREIDQVIYKIRKKVADGRQIALANGMPALLFVALTRRGADSQSARIGIDECFSHAAFAALSGVVLADSWTFRKTRWYPGRNPDNPLHPEELERITSWYGDTSTGAI